MMAELKLDRIVFPTGAPGRLVGRVETLWRSFARWREQRRAIACLHVLSDHELRDIGLHRSRIGAPVLGGDREGQSCRHFHH